MTTPDTTRSRDPHTDHDREALAAYAAGDLLGPDRARVEALLHSCPACSALVDDLRAIAAATRVVPAPASVARDFRLSPSDAARLRGGWWRRFVPPGAGPAWTLRPFAAALTTLGVAGLLIALVPFAPLGQSAGSGASERTAAEATDQSKNGVPATAYGPAAAPSSSTDIGGVPAVLGGGSRTAGPLDSVTEQYDAPTPAATEAPTLVPLRETSTPASAPGLPLVLVSLAFIAAGVALFALARGTLRGR